jgi:hypothetical protein
MNMDSTRSPQAKRFNRLIERLSTGELTDDERRELERLCAGDDALRAEVRHTEAILAAAHAADVDGPSDFEWAAFTTRLKATVESVPPRAYSRLRMWLSALGMSPAFRPRRLALAASAVAIAALAVVIGLIAFRPAKPPTIARRLPDVHWTFSDIEETYSVAEILPDEDVLGLEQELQDELDAVRQVIEEAPSFNGNGMSDEEYIFG